MRTCTYQGQLPSRDFGGQLPARVALGLLCLRGAPRGGGRGWRVSLLWGWVSLGAETPFRTMWATGALPRGRREGVALGHPCCHWLLLEHLLSVSFSATRPLLTLLGLHRREEGGLVLGELRAEDPEWLAPTPGVWRSPTPWILQSDKGCHATIMRVTSSPTRHRSQRGGALPYLLLRIIPGGREHCGS